MYVSKKCVTGPVADKHDCEHWNVGKVHCHGSTRSDGVNAHLTCLEAKVILTDMMDYGPKMVQDHLGSHILEFSFVHVGVDRCMDVGTQIGENLFDNCCPKTDRAKLGVVCPVLSDYRISFLILLEVECY
jgi:hypothetical protein